MGLRRRGEARGQAVDPDAQPDYFLITRPIAKFLYRLARKAAGQTEARYGLSELHKRSGSKLPRHKFRQAIEEIVASAVPLPDYDLALIKGEKEPVLRMVNRNKALPATAEG